MAKITEYDAATGVVPTAAVPLYDPTADEGSRDQRLTEAVMARVPSVVYGFPVDAEITVADEDTDVRDISVQLLDADGDAIAEAAVVHLLVFADAAGAALATTGGSTGIALDADGLILATVVAKKVFLAKTDDAGLLTLTWTDTGTEAAYLGVVLPDGRIVIGATMTNS